MLARNHILTEPHRLGQQCGLVLYDFFISLIINFQGRVIDGHLGGPKRVVFRRALSAFDALDDTVQGLGRLELGLVTLLTRRQSQLTDGFC